MQVVGFEHSYSGFKHSHTSEGRHLERPIVARHMPGVVDWMVMACTAPRTDSNSTREESSEVPGIEQVVSKPDGGWGPPGRPNLSDASPRGHYSERASEVIATTYVDFGVLKTHRKTLFGDKTQFSRWS